MIVCVSICYSVGRKTISPAGTLKAVCPLGSGAGMLRVNGGVLDLNLATDSDMWLTYTLLQTGSLWQDKRYTRLGQAMLARIKAEEIGVLPGVGPMLLPGPSGFAVSEQAWRLNPSYLAPQLLRAFAQGDPDGPWLRIARALPPMLRSISTVGLAPDWAIYDATKGWLPDTTAGAYVGSYDAIRVYLWVGLLDDADPLKPVLLSALHGMRDYLLRHHPAYLIEKITCAADTRVDVVRRDFLLRYCRILMRPMKKN